MGEIGASDNELDSAEESASAMGDETSRLEFDDAVREEDFGDKGAFKAELDVLADAQGDSVTKGSAVDEPEEEREEEEEGVGEGDNDLPDFVNLAATFKNCDSDD